MARKTQEERFWEKVDRSGVSDCWLWTGAIQPNGYGRFWHYGKQGYAHRAAYRMFVGPIPEGLQLDHLCRVRHCVNPDHLEAVTLKENLNRGFGGSPGGRARATTQLAKAQCSNGHPYSKENLWVSKNGWRQCRACGRENKRKHYKPKPRVYA